MILILSLILFALLMKLIDSLSFTSRDRKRFELARKEKEITGRYPDDEIRQHNELAAFYESIKEFEIAENHRAIAFRLAVNMTKEQAQKTTIPIEKKTTEARQTGKGYKEIIEDGSIVFEFNM